MNGVLKSSERSLADTSSTKVDKRRLHKTCIRLATWNVRTMSQEKLPILTRELKRLAIGIVGISEMRFVGKGSLSNW